jgi:signal transduction histidine kinase/CheY-like chemotaxis protein
MEKTQSDFRAELSIPIEWVAAFPVLVGVVVLSASNFVNSEDCKLLLQIGGVSIGCSGVIAWLLAGWQAWLGKTFDLTLLSAAIMLLAVQQRQPMLLTLLVLPTGLAAVLVSLPAAVVLAGVKTVFLLLWPAIGMAGASWIATWTIILTLWGVLGLVAIARLPVNQTAEWASHFYRDALSLREEAFERRAALEQTLKDLSNANRQLALASKRMAGLRTLAEEAQKTKTMFLAKVSHEFRTPLNMIIGLVELMVESPHIYAVDLPPEMESDLDVVLRNCRHLSSMVNDVLDLTRVESGRVTLHREWVHLPEIIAEAVTAVEPLIDKKGLAFDLSCPEDLPEIYCDRTRIRQVVLNLVSNAARFTENGGISLKVDTKDGYVVAQVKDTGPGISEEDIARIFEPFSQANERMWQDKGGSGLGLSISRQFVQLHQGRLWVESELGVGSSFNFKLPVSQPLEPVARPGHYIREDWVWREADFRTEGTRTAEQARKPSVIVRDEAGTLRSELSRYSEQINLVGARSTADVNRLISDHFADVILLNADADSLVLQENLTQGGAVTVQTYVPAYAARAEVAGAGGYLTKPVSSEMLRKAIEDVPAPVRRILVIDDNPDILQLFSRTLSVLDREMEIVTANGGEEALSLVQQGHFDLVLLDVLMPDMDGWSWLDHIRREMGAQAPPVYLVSAQDPADNPPSSSYMMITTEGGISVRKLLRCSLEVSQILLTPEGALDPTPQPDDLGESAWRGTQRRPEPTQDSPL